MARARRNPEGTWNVGTPEPEPRNPEPWNRTWNPNPNLRSIPVDPAVSLTIVAVIALSTSLSATVFAIVDGVLFKRLPYPAAAIILATAAVGTLIPALRAARTDPVTTLRSEYGTGDAVAPTVVVISAGALVIEEREPRVVRAHP
jgi:hypothetical protein